MCPDFDLLRFRPFCIALCLIVIPARFAPAAPAAKSEVIVYETSRTLAVLPALNATGEERLDYLRLGIPKMIRNDLESIGYISIGDPAVRFVARPYPHGKNRQAYRPGKRRLLLKVKIIDETDLLSEVIDKKPVKQAELLGADYVLSGSYTGSSHGDITIAFDLFDARRMVHKSMQYTYDIQAVYDHTGELSRDIQQFFRFEAGVRLTVETKKPGALVFLDDAYLGQTPLSHDVIPDRYTLLVRQEGYADFKKTIDLKGATKVDLSSELQALKHDALLSVASDPPGADVYLNMTYLGKTPLVREDLPAGTHRIRISKEGYIDRFVGVKLGADQKGTVAVTLKPGDTFAHFRNPHYLILDWSYNDVSFYSMLTSLLFYGGYWKLKSDSDTIANSIRGDLLPSFGATDLRGMSVYQLYLLEQNRKAVDAKMGEARLSAALSGTTLLVSALLLWRGISVDDRETGELSDRSDPGPVFFTTVRSGFQGEEAVAGFTFRFR